MRLQMPKGSDEIGHVLLATGSGAVRLPDIEPGPIQCPHCGHTFKGTDAV